MEKNLIHVKYLNDHYGFVDDVTLYELTITRKIKQFYRPSQEKYIDIRTEPVRLQPQRSGAFMRRASDKENLKKIDGNHRGLLSRILNKNKDSQNKSTYGDWFEKGCISFQADDYEGALRAFANCILLDPLQKLAYINRAMLYELVGNLAQAIDDYCVAIKLDPEDAKLYYMCGLVRKRFGQHDAALKDFEKAVQLHYQPALDLIRNSGVTL